MTEETELLVVGAGAAGLAAALEGARLGLSTELLDPVGPGGLLMNAGVVDGCPGLAAKLSGPDLVSRLTDQVMALDVSVDFSEVRGLRAAEGALSLSTDAGEKAGQAIVLATGGRHRHLQVPGE